MHRGILELGAVVSALAMSSAGTLRAAEADALAIDRIIQQRHLPHGGILEPIFAAPTSDEIVNYTRCGDSAIWTGHYLAAETFRYVVTRSPEAFDNAVRAIQALKTLVDVTGTNLLARCAMPAESPWKLGMLAEERDNGGWGGFIDNRLWYWVGNTSRDQYSGAFFGLSIAYDGLDNEDLRAAIKDLVTRMLDYLRYYDWRITMPDGTAGASFFGRFDQELSFLAVGAQVNPERFGPVYRRERILLAPLVITPVSIDALDDNGAYFKFNLDTINLYNLIRLETDGGYRGQYMNAYDLLRKTTDDHGNAHFNMIDRSLRGPDERRDAETRDLLARWLLRDRRDFFVDLRGTVAECDGHACQPIPVEQRVRTDFLWQRSPFQLSGGGQGLVETSGIDYLLPYWMGRFYGVVTD